MRNGFMTVGDSAESLELRDMLHGGRGASRAVVERGDETARDVFGPIPGNSGKMGIMVEKEVSQTIDDRK